MPLSDSRIRSAKPSARIVKLSDGNGLQLWVMPNGSRLWRLAYRHGGKQKLLALGKYPDVGLADARGLRDEHRRVLARGVDPAVARRVSRSNTFDAIATEWLQRQKDEGRSEATAAKHEWLVNLARPALGPRPISEISAAEVLAVLRVPEGRGHLESARRLRSTLSGIFRFAIATARAEHDPSAPLRGALRTPRTAHRAALLDPEAFGGLLRSINGYGGQPETRIGLTLLALTAARPGELRLATWDEFDLDAAAWSIPTGHTKQRRPHRAPLARQAVDLLRELRRLSGRGTLAFPGLRGNRPLSENTFSYALRGLGYGGDEASPHGFRSTFSSLTNESGHWNVDAVEKHLSHVDRNDVRAAYQRSEFWSERVRLAQWWADVCDHLRAGGTDVPPPAPPA